MSSLAVPIPMASNKAPDNALSMSEASISTQTSATSLEDDRVLDIGGSKLETGLKQAVEKELLWKGGPHCPAGHPQRMLPWSLHSDDRGAALWSDITYLSRYYQTRDEIKLFQAHGKHVARHVHDNSVMLDMGCG
jgi:Histidine-specific methyltransferase, SAM-dependent